MVIENKLWLEERLTSYFRMQGICSFKQSAERVWEPNQPEQQQKKKTQQPNKNKHTFSISEHELANIFWLRLWTLEMPYFLRAAMSCEVIVVVPSHVA